MADTAVLRWQVPVDDAEHTLDVGDGPVLAVAGTEGLWSDGPAHWVEFWALGEPGVRRTFRVFGTGQPIPAGWVWRGTSPRLRGLVWHLFERTGGDR